MSRNAGLFLRRRYCTRSRPTGDVGYCPTNVHQSHRRSQREPHSCCQADSRRLVWAYTRGGHAWCIVLINQWWISKSSSITPPATAIRTSTQHYVRPCSGRDMYDSPEVHIRFICSMPHLKTSNQWIQALHHLPDDDAAP
jgi:hypothetical protein